MLTGLEAGRYKTKMVLVKGLFLIDGTLDVSSPDRSRQLSRASFIMALTPFLRTEPSMT
jgi:hypothetical protein